ncbi:MFS transporter [Oleiharenicola lentus]|uniref:MFS transporter n=1 Tax=Oleiharenicola lentus TaxID=2508720 RepID=UPI003F6662BD
MNVTSKNASGQLSPRTLWLMAIACGVCVANICYNQPLLGDFAVYFGATASQVGWVSVATQAGYGLGLLFFLPLGDILERRKLVLNLIWICAGLLAVTAAAPSLPLLILGNLLIGATAMSAQILIPLAVEMSPANEQGRTVGVMMTGLLGGILLARTLAGFVGGHFGWRAMFALAALMMVTLALLLRGRLPHRPTTLKLSYTRLMRSLWAVLKTQPRLWRPAVVGALSFATFTAFWTSLAFLMSEEFHRGSTETGLFGVVGLVGALAAPYAGKLADKRGAAFTVSIALVVILAAFGLMWVWVTIPMLVVGVLLMDVGVQTVQVAEQGRVLSLLPEARSRLNTLYMVSRFAGGAVGSLIGAFAWTHGRWPVVCGAACGLIVVAMIVHFVAQRYEVAATPAFDDEGGDMKLASSAP